MGKVEVGEPVGEVGVRDGLAMAFGVNENYEDRSPNNTITGTNCILRIYVQIQTPLGRARGTATGWSPFYYEPVQSSKFKVSSIKPK